MHTAQATGAGGKEGPMRKRASLASKCAFHVCTQAKSLSAPVVTFEQRRDGIYWNSKECHICVSLSMPKTNSCLSKSIIYFYSTSSLPYIYYELHRRKYGRVKLCQNFYQKKFSPTYQYFVTPMTMTGYQLCRCSISLFLAE